MQDQRRISIRPPQLVAPPQFNTNLTQTTSSPSPYNPLDQRNNIGFNASYSQPRLSRSHQFMTVVPSPLSADFARQQPMRQSLLLPSLGGEPRQTLMPNRSAFLPTLASPLSSFAPQNQGKYLAPLNQVSPLGLKNISINRSSHMGHATDRVESSAERFPSMGERNLLKYLEKQNVAIERLTERVTKQLKTDSAQRERDNMGVRVIESKTDISAVRQQAEPERRPRKMTNDDTSLIYDLTTNNSSLINNNSSTKRPSIIITATSPKTQQTALETIGQLYLMGKLPGGSPTENRSMEILEKNSSEVKKSVHAKTTTNILKKQETVESFNNSDSEDDSDSDSESLSDEEEGKTSENRTIILSSPKSSPRRHQSPKRERKYLKERREQLDIPSYERSYNAGRSTKTEANLDKTLDKTRPKAKSIIKLPNKDKDSKSRRVSVASQKPRKSVRIVEPNEQAQFNKQILLAKRENARMRIQTYMWVLMYGKVLAKTVQKKASQRRENISQAICLNYETHFANAEAFLISAGEKYIRELVSEPKLELFCYKKALNDKILDVRINFIAERVKGLFDKLIQRTTSDALGKNLIHFLISISENTGVLPRDFMFDFELKRLQFTYYGTLKQMTPNRSKMIMGSLILIRILIHKIILRPWTVFYDIKKSKVNKQNLLTVASVLYYITTGLYKRNLALQHNNQAFLTPETRIKPRSNPLPALDEVVEVDEETALKQKEATKDSEPEAISGLIPKDFLKCFFSDRRKIADELKACFEGWHDKLYEVTHEEYCKMSAKQREKMVS